MKTLIVIPAALAALTIATAVQAQDAAKLAQEKACMTCHQVGTKLIGPAYKEVAAKYRGDKNAAATLVKSVKGGSQGKWGQVPMPPNTSVSDKEAQVLVNWILSQK